MRSCSKARLVTTYRRRVALLRGSADRGADVGAGVRVAAVGDAEIASECRAGAAGLLATETQTD